PFFRLFGKESLLRCHVSTEISAHNYGEDDRRQAYRFLSDHFGLPPIERETAVGDDLRTYDELAVGLPRDNLTILGLARKSAEKIVREPIPPGRAERTAWATSQRARLRDVVRDHPLSVGRAWRGASTTHDRR